MLNLARKLVELVRAVLLKQYDLHMFTYPDQNLCKIIDQFVRERFNNDPEQCILAPKHLPDFLRFDAGFHASPSMDHLHLHILSHDRYSPFMRTRHHFNSFTTPFYVHLDDVISSLSVKRELPLVLRSPELMEHYAQQVPQFQGRPFEDMDVLMKAVRLAAVRDLKRAIRLYFPTKTQTDSSKDSSVVTAATPGVRISLEETRDSTRTYCTCRI